MPNAAFLNNLSTRSADFEVFVTKLLAGKLKNTPARLKEAMHYAMLNGGKRLRPWLVLETTALLNPAHNNAQAQIAAQHIAAALECIHCYSLIHDDLPAMDNDDMRRGKPTLHKAYDEATAILAGDALLTLAFEIIAAPSLKLDPHIKLALISALSTASGAKGMVGGQMLDLAAEGRFANGIITPLSLDEIITLQSMKTGALIAYAVEAGALIAPASIPEKAALAAYAKALGLAFQIRDDLLDYEGEAAEMGKAVAKDAARGKATFVSLFGLSGAKQRLTVVSLEAETALLPFGEKAAMLKALLSYNLLRRK